MTRTQSRLQHLSNLLVGGTGLVYFVMLYFMQPADEFAVVNHPWQPHVQHLHVLFAPLLVFATGLIWRTHFWAKYKSGRPARRFSGLELGLSFVPMTASGYLLQISVEASWRTVWGWVHLVTGLLWIAGYLVHQFVRRGAR